jgi:hypothetical protein
MSANAKILHRELTVIQGSSQRYHETPLESSCTPKPPGRRGRVAYQRKQIDKTFAPFFRERVLDQLPMDEIVSHTAPTMDARPKIRGPSPAPSFK